jgi:hypothetical protein
MWRRRRRSESEPAGDGSASVDFDGRLATESDLYLSGKYADHLDETGDPKPAWAWINTLAHGGEEDIRGLATRTGKQGSADAIVTAVAARMVTLIDRGVRLLDLQRNTLIPLEIAIGASPVTAEVVTSADLGRAILTAFAAGLEPLSPDLDGRRRRK